MHDAGRARYRRLRLRGSGRGPLLVHATGFCAEVFGPLARSLGRRFRCWGLDLRAHGRSDRPTDGDFAWSGFCTDVLTAIDHLGLSHPYAFGHSCGGAAILLAEQARPGTFASLYCFEPVVLDEPAGALPVDANPLTEGARRRRQTFPVAEDALVNFSAKPPLSGLDPEVLRIYVEQDSRSSRPKRVGTAMPSGCDAGGTTRPPSMPTVPPTGPSGVSRRSAVLWSSAVASSPMHSDGPSSKPTPARSGTPRSRSCPEWAISAPSSSPACWPPPSSEPGTPPATHPGPRLFAWPWIFPVHSPHRRSRHFVTVLWPSGSAPSTICPRSPRLDGQGHAGPPRPRAAVLGAPAWTTLARGGGDRIGPRVG